MLPAAGGICTHFAVPWYFDVRAHAVSVNIVAATVYIIDYRETERERERERERGRELFPKIDVVWSPLIATTRAGSLTIIND